MEANSLFSFVLILFLDCFDFGFGNIAKSHEMRCDMDFISYFMSRQHLMVDIYGKLWPRIIDFTPKWLFQEINLTCCLIHSYFKCVCEWSSISRLKIEHATSLSRSIIFEKKKTCARVHSIVYSLQMDINSSHHWIVCLCFIHISRCGIIIYLCGV